MFKCSNAHVQTDVHDTTLFLLQDGRPSVPQYSRRFPQPTVIRREFVAVTGSSGKRRKYRNKNYNVGLKNIKVSKPTIRLNLLYFFLHMMENMQIKTYKKKQIYFTDFPLLPVISQHLLCFLFQFLYTNVTKKYHRYFIGFSPLIKSPLVVKYATRAIYIYIY